MSFRELCALAEQVVASHMTPIEEAKRLGTFEQNDRSKQYREPEPRKLLTAVNEAWAKIRALEKDAKAKDVQIAQLQLDKRQLFSLLAKSITTTALITGAAVEGFHYFLGSLK